MKLYVCWGTFQVPLVREHPCRNAYLALKEAGHEPEVIKSYGLAQLPDMTRGRKEVKRLSGESWVPLLVLDDGEVIGESQKIVEWAQAHPANAGAAA